MAATKSAEKQPGQREILITRVFAAPRELVWKAWTEPEHFRRWWGPKNFTAPVARFDLRVGGTFLYCMQSPEGQKFWGTGVFREIVPPERLVFSDSFADEHGNVVPASHYGFADPWPLELQVTVTFEEKDGKTTMTLRHSGLPEGEGAQQAAGGWNESFDKLEAMLAEDAA